MKKSLIVLSFLMMVSCGDKEEDKTETFTVTFENKTLNQNITVSDNTASVAPLFGTFTLQPNATKQITYTCEDCPVFDFNYEHSGVGGARAWVTCVCSDGTTDNAYYTFGYCPTYVPGEHGFLTDWADGICSSCKRSNQECPS